MQQIKLIAMDMDRTLLADVGELPPDFSHYVQMLHSIGIHCVIASGRPLYTLKEMFCDLWEQMSFICDNGGGIFHCGQAIFQSLIPPADYSQIIRFAEDKNEGVPFLCATDAAYLLKKHEQHIHFLRNFYTNICCVDEESLDTVIADVDKITIYYPDKSCHSDFYRWYQPTYGERFCVSLCDTRWIDVMNRGVDKGAAMRILGQALAISPAQMMALGDSHSDIQMLEAVGYSYVMENAAEDMRQYARFVAQSNNNYIVKKIFRKYLLLSVLAALTAPLGMMVDDIVIGDFLGAETMAAYGLASPVYLLLTAFSGIIASGSLGLCAQYIGKEQPEQVRQIFSSAMLWSSILFLCYLAALLFFPQPIACLPSASDSAVSKPTPSSVTATS